jgi:uncharacterized membrane protein YccC
LHVLDGLALLVDAPGYSLPGHRGFRLVVADWLPPVVNAVRAFLAIGAAALFWVATAWPDGATAIIFAAVVVSVFAPRGDLAYGGAIVFTLGTAGAAVSAAIVNFAVLPSLSNFPAFCAAMGLVLVPVGFVAAWSRNPAVRAVFTVWGILFVPILGPRNEMTYDPGQFYILPWRRSQDACSGHYRFCCYRPSRRRCECAASLPSPCATCAALR